MMLDGAGAELHVVARPIAAIGELHHRARDRWSSKALARRSAALLGRSLPPRSASWTPTQGFLQPRLKPAAARSRRAACRCWWSSPATLRQAAWRCLHLARASPALLKRLGVAIARLAAGFARACRLEPRTASSPSLRPTGRPRVASAVRPNARAPRTKVGQQVIVHVSRCRTASDRPPAPAHRPASRVVDRVQGGVDPQPPAAAGRRRPAHVPFDGRSPTASPRASWPTAAC